MKVDPDSKTLNSHDDTSHKYSPKLRLANNSAHRKHEAAKDEEYEDEKFDEEQYGDDFDD